MQTKALMCNLLPAHAPQELLCRCIGEVTSINPVPPLGTHLGTKYYTRSLFQLVALMVRTMIVIAELGDYNRS